MFVREAWKTNNRQFENLKSFELNFVLQHAEEREVDALSLTTDVGVGELATSGSPASPEPAVRLNILNALSKI